MQEIQKAFNLLKKNYHAGKLGHAFLLETNDQDRCLTDLLDFFKLINCENEYKDGCTKCNLCHLIETQQLPSMLILKPDGQSIKKEQVLELKKSFQTKPVFSKYNIYVILNAEYLNSSSANTMLKFLEEPEEHILGVFITNNKENVIDTIKSRCQIYMNYYSDMDLLPSSDWMKIAKEYIMEIELTHEEAILYTKNNILPMIKEKEDLVRLFQAIYTLYMMMLNAKLNKTSLIEELQELSFFLKKEVQYFSHQIRFVTKILEQLQYNLNTQLVLDRFVLESR